jgi:CRP-like cAMP-binding protein/Zn-dependent protease
VQYIILIAIAFVAITLAVDTMRQRAARQRALDVRSLLAARSGRVSSALSLPALLRARLAAHEEPSGGSGAVPDVWDRLSDLVDPDRFRPKVDPRTEIKVFEMRWGNDYAMVARPDRTLHFELQPWEAELMREMDGERSSQALIVEHLERAGDLDPGSVLGLVTSLRVYGFLEPALPDAAALVRDRLDRASTGRRKVRELATKLQISWEGAERLVIAMYQGGLKAFFHRRVAIVSAIFAAIGLVCFVAVELSGRYTLSATEAPAEALLFLVLGLFLTFAHELGHAMSLHHHGRRVLAAGFFIFFGSPAFFVDSSDGLMMDREERIAQSFAGPFAELIVAGVASILMILTPGTYLAAFLYRFALINYFVILMNLIPLLELDGYWIFADFIQVPDLRKRSLQFVQGDIWHKLRTRESFSKQELGLAAYGTIGIAFTVFSFYTAYFFWQRIFGGIVTSLWAGGLVSRALLVALALAFFGPAIRGAISLGRLIYRRTREYVRRARFRAQRTWRIEAAAMIDALPAFEDLPEDVLSELAGRVELVRVRDGQAVFRRGEEADAFYVIRAGAINIEDEDPRVGDVRVLSVLERGDAFGELGLLDAAPRSATARAAGDVQLFVVGKPAFDALLADDIRAPSFAPTMQAYAELRALPPFRALSTDDLALILDHGSWLTPHPGEYLIEQGEVGDAFYLVASGQFDVVQNGAPVASLGPGDHFGEVALLTDQPRNATVIAHTPARVFRLDRDAFGRVVARSFRRGTTERTPNRNMEH